MFETTWDASGWIRFFGRQVIGLATPLRSCCWAPACQAPVQLNRQCECSVSVKVRPMQNRRELTLC